MSLSMSISGAGRALSTICRPVSPRGLNTSGLQKFSHMCPISFPSSHQWRLSSWEVCSVVRDPVGVEVNVLLQ